MKQKSQAQRYADTIYEMLEKIERKFDQARDMIDFARSWDDENAMFYGMVVNTLANTNHMLVVARSSLEGLSKLADPNEPEDLPF